MCVRACVCVRVCVRVCVCMPACPTDKVKAVEHLLLSDNMYVMSEEQQ